MSAVAFAGRGRKCLGCAYAAVCWSQEPCKSCDGESKFSVPGDFSQGKLPAKSDCPLPRIGSKAWGWHHSCYAIASDRNNYHLVNDEKKQIWLLYDVDGVLVATSRKQAEAQNIAELLTRRDWRRENGRKT